MKLKIFLGYDAGMSGFCLDKNELIVDPFHHQLWTDIAPYELCTLKLYNKYILVFSKTLSSPNIFNFLLQIYEYYFWFFL